MQMQPLHKGNDKRNFACSTYFPERNASSPAARFCWGKKGYCPSRDLDIRVLYTNFEKSSKNVNIFGKNGRNCPKPISRIISGTRSVTTMIRREIQIFSEQTLPALMVLNDPADHIKQKIFFSWKTIVSTFWVFNWF